jgi:hypothetical protein
MKVTRLAGLLLVVLLGSSVLPGCDKFGAAKTEKLEFNTPYQVVFLDNNNTYIGKMQQVGTDYLHMTNVYYIQSMTDPETKQVTNKLIKRGQELHKPDFMYINTRHVLLIEPVVGDSQVAKLIEQSEAQKK